MTITETKNGSALTVELLHLVFNDQTALDQAVYSAEDGRL